MNMINKEVFEFHKSIVDWMMDKGTPFIEAMGIVSYAEQSEKCIPEAYLEIRVNHPYRVEDKVKQTEK